MEAQEYSTPYLLSTMQLYIVALFVILRGGATVSHACSTTDKEADRDSDSLQSFQMSPVVPS